MFSLALLGWILAVEKLLPRGAGSCDAPGSETCGSAAVWGENKQKWVRPREMLPLSELQQEWVRSAGDGAAPRCVCAARVPAPCGTVLGWRLFMKLLILTYFIPKKALLVWESGAAVCVAGISSLRCFYGVFELGPYLLLKLGRGRAGTEGTFPPFPPAFAPGFMLTVLLSGPGRANPRRVDIWLSPASCWQTKLLSLARR